MPTPVDPLYSLLNGLPASTIVLFLVIKEVLAYRKNKANGNAVPTLKLDDETKGFFREMTGLVRNGCKDMHEVKNDMSAVRDTCIKVEGRIPRGK